MSAWFLLSAMGIYQQVPGSMRYSIGSPLYKRLKFRLDNGKTLEIVAEGNTPKTPYVHAVHVNGKALSQLYIDYWQLRAGGVVSFTMSATPCNNFPCATEPPATII